MLKLEQHELDDLAILTSGGKIFSPKSDFVFKNIFSNEEVVTGFLKAILDIPHEEYSKIRAISIDYSVMERSASMGDVLVIPCDCGWNDIGSWDTLDVLHETDGKGNVFVGDVVAVDVKDAVIYSTSRVVTAVDVDNIVIVETPDAIMVCRKDKAQEVKRIVDRLKNDGRSGLL